MLETSLKKILVSKDTIKVLSSQELTSLNIYHHWKDKGGKMLNSIIYLFLNLYSGYTISHNCTWNSKKVTYKWKPNQTTVSNLLHFTSINNSLIYY